MNLDFTPLSTTVSPMQAVRKIKSYSLRYKIGLYVLTVILVIAVSIFVILLSVGTVSGSGGLFLVFLAGIALLGLLSIYRMVRTSIRLELFALHNGLPYVHDGAGSGYAGTYFEQQMVRVTDAFRTMNPPLIELGNYQLVADRQQLMHGYLRLKLPRRLPHMMLRAKSNSIDLPSDMLSSQKLSLEGDFDRHFTLYAPKDYERDALYIFTPDVMARFIDITSAYNCEIIDDELYLYSGKAFKLTNVELLQKLLSLGENLSTKIQAQVSRYSDDRAPIAMSNYGRLLNGEQIPTLPAKSTQIGSTGRRLKAVPANVSIVVGLITLVFICYAIVWLISHSKHASLENAQIMRRSAATLIIGLITSLVGVFMLILQRRK